MVNSTQSNVMREVAHYIVLGSGSILTQCITIPVLCVE